MDNLAISLHKKLFASGCLCYYKNMRKQEPITLERKLRNFLKYVDTSLPKEVCWEWRSKNTLHGYGSLEVGACYRKDRFRQRAHRFSYEYFFKTTIPEGLFVLHKCDNKLCCNPHHLYLGDHAQNMVDAKERSRFGTHEEIGDRNRKGLLTRKEKYGQIQNNFGEFMSPGEDPAIRKGRVIPFEERSEKIKAKIPRGGNHYKSHLNDQDILDIVELRKSGLTLSEISEIYKINVPGIHKICRGKRWSHVQREII